MTFWTQVRQVLHRDLQRLAPWLGLYVLSLVIAVARAAEWFGAARSATLPNIALVGLIPTLIAVVLILRDSPARADAYWAVLPFTASAMVVAKLIETMGLVLACGVAVVVSLSAWQLPPTALGAEPMFALISVLLFLVGVALLTTASRRPGAIALVGTAMLGLVLLSLRMDASARLLVPSVWWGMVAALLLLSVAWLHHAYHARFIDRPARLMTLCGGGAVALFPVVMSRAPAPQTRIERLAAPDDSSVTLRIPPMDRASFCSATQLTVPLDVVAPVGQRVELMRPKLRVFLANGAAPELERDSWMAMGGEWGPLLPKALAHRSTDRVGVVGERRTRSTAIAFDLTQHLGPRMVCSEIMGVELHMQLRSTIGRELLRVPWSLGAEAMRPGYRVRVERTNIGTARTAGVRVAMLGDVLAGERNDLAGLQFALLNPRGGQLMRFDTGEYDDWSNTTDLPGVRHLWVRERLTLYDADGSATKDWREWRDSVVLLVIKPVMQPYAWRTVAGSFARRSEPSPVPAPVVPR